MSILLLPFKVFLIALDFLVSLPGRVVRDFINEHVMRSPTSLQRSSPLTPQLCALHSNSIPTLLLAIIFIIISHTI